MPTILENDQAFALRLPVYTVVLASAGSGKTTALKQRFLQLFLSRSIPNNGLRNILAITFTNNAAREMKRRILDSLKLISLGDPKALKEFGPLLSLKPGELQVRANQQIDEILENYSDFQIQTIDSFLSRVFRASALELGLSPDLEIVLDSGPLLDQAFSLFARDLSEGSSSTRLFADLLVLLSESRAGDDRFLWNPYADLSDTVKDLYARVTMRSQELRREDYSAIIRQSDEQLVQHVLALDALMTRPGITKAKAFEKYVGLAKDRSVERLTELKFPPPITKSGNDSEAYDQALAESQALREEIKTLRRNLIHLKARQHYQPYAEALGMFQSSIERVKREQGCIDIGDVVKKLVDYLKPGIVPEIYYSLAAILRHYLIDEFQDTNPIQWDNLEPLVADALAIDGSFFIVGDTKQSIYSFRGADWRIMKRLVDEDVFPSARKDLRHLRTNFRSHEKILTFNNDVFHSIIPTRVPGEAPSASGLATDTVEPRPEFRNRGYVELISIPSDAEIGETGQLPECQNVLAIVADCLSRGYRHSDITILSPRNRNIIEVSSWLNEQHIPFISHSSLDVRTRAITGELLALLRFLDSPVDDLSFATVLLGNVFERLLRSSNESLRRSELRSFLFTHRRTKAQLRPLYVNFRETYPDIWERYLEHLFNVVGYLPVYDLLSEIYAALSLFALLPEEEATLVKILEVVKEFEGTGENSLKAFLKYAEDSSEDADWNIDIPTNADAVKVMTIHKAKGLESRVVIVLLYDSRPRTTGLYFQEDGDELRLVRLTQHEAENVEELELLYEEKVVAQTVDDLNKLYVALTRAEEEMYVISVKSDRAKIPSTYFPEQGYEAARKPTVASQASPPKVSIHLLHELPRIPVKTIDYAGIALEETRRGEFFHSILELIHTIDDSLDRQLDAAIETVQLRSLYRGNADQVKAILLIALGNPDSEPLFLRKEGRMVLNEQEFATSDGALVRMDRVVVDPDRVTVIDYKTGDEKPSYDEQITLYIEVLKDFYRDRPVHGLILYLDRNVSRMYS